MDFKQLSILLADDYKDDILFFDRALKELPISAKLTTVNDGEQLMNHHSENSEHLPDVLFLDINMPRKNGFECLTEIKQNEKLKDLPVVIFSTSSSHDNISRVFRTGAHIYIRKPGNFAQLKQVIHHALPIAAEKLVSKIHLKYILNA